MSYLLMLLFLGLVVLVHEWGHYVAARHAKIPIAVFSVGFGPKLWSIKRKETEFRISLVPLGGYVLPAVEDEEEFLRISPKRRAFMALGGPIASFLLTFVYLWIRSVAVNGISWVGAVIRPLTEFSVLMGAMIQGIIHLFIKPDQLSGIIGILAQGGGYAGTDLLKGLQVAMALSLNLAVINMIPLPAFDGGKVLLCLLEKINPKTVKWQVPLTIAGWVCLLLLMVYVTVLDVGKYLLS